MSPLINYQSHPTVEFALVRIEYSNEKQMGFYSQLTIQVLSIKV